MADWTDQDPNTLLPGEPWTSAKALAAFENTEAVAEGAPGAPRIALKSIERLVAGDSVRSQQTSVISTDSNFTLGFDFIQIGTIRCKSLFVSGDTFGASVTVTRIRNGGSTVLYNDAAPLSGLDVAVLPGDRIEILTTVSAGGPGGTFNPSFSVASGSLWPGNQAKLEGNDV